MEDVGYVNANVALAEHTADDACWHRYRDVDPKVSRQARDEIITRYAPLVTHIATRMVVRLPDSVELADLVSYGMFGLIDAVSKYEPERGLKFETYASTRIRGAIIDELRAADWVPRSVRAKARSVEEATRAMEQRLARPVNDAEVAHEIGCSANDVRNIRAQVALSHFVALDGMASGDSDVHALDRHTSVAVPDIALGVERLEEREILVDAIQGVREREMQVLQLYYYENLTLAQIGEVLGVTESRVSQIHSGAVKKLREALVKTGAF